MRGEGRRFFLHLQYRTCLIPWSNSRTRRHLDPSHKVLRVNDLFAPASGHWQRVSPNLSTVRRILICGPVTLVGIIATVVLAFTLGWWWIIAAVATIGIDVWAWTWSARNQASWGYTEEEEDLLVTSGVMFKRLVAVPYGRMQFVDVNAGPIHRAFGIATVTLHTASSQTAADIPGLAADEALRLRNRLTELGESHGAGV